MIIKKKWENAQKEELKCWAEQTDKINSSEYLRLKREYWQKILEKIGIDKDTLREKKFLEIGCGPAGITLLFNSGEIKKTGTIIDPLIDEYRSIFPGKFGKCREVGVPFETWVDSDQGCYEIVFAINVIDHCNSIDSFIQKLYEHATPCNAQVLVGVNTHVSRWSEKIWQLFQRFIEPHHPYQFTQSSYEELFKKFFTVMSVVDIEDEVVWINRGTGNGSPSFLKKIKSVIRLVKPVNAFIKILEIAGYPVHDFHGKGKSIFRHKVFILKPV